MNWSFNAVRSGFAAGLVCYFVVTASNVWSGDWPQFRGPHRDGLSTETGLLQRWPQEGPRLAWKASGVGEGYSSVSIAHEHVYTMGDLADAAYVFCLQQKDGEITWSAKVGETGGNYKGPRCTPTVDGPHVFVLGQFGDLVCFEAATGHEVWRKNLPNDFQGEAGAWNYTESVLIDGNTLVCTPGGKQATMVALNKQNGDVLWKGTTPDGDPAGYASPIVAVIDGTRMYVQLLAGGAAAFDAKEGRLLWRYGTDTDHFKDNTANIPTPIVQGNRIFFSAGYGRGGGLVQVTRQGDEWKAVEIYFDQSLNNKHGGVIWVGDYLYGDHDSSGRPFCAEAMTGKTVWRKGRDGDGTGSMALTYADGHLYCRYENGIVSLVPAVPSGYQETSSFKIPDGTEPSWPHPVVLDGKLYLRDQNVVWCYDIAE